MVSPTAAALALTRNSSTSARRVALGRLRRHGATALASQTSQNVLLGQDASQRTTTSRRSFASRTSAVLKSSHPAALPAPQQTWSLADLRRTLLQLQQQYNNNNHKTTSSSSASFETTETSSQRHLSTLSQSPADITSNSDDSDDSEFDEEHADLFDDNITISPTQLQELASRKPTPLKLADMYKYGRGTCPDQRIRNAQFLYEELPVRVAQRAVDLLTLPHGLSQAQPIRQVARIYLEYICQLQAATFPTNAAQEQEFTDLLQHFILDRTSIPVSIARGVRVWRSQFPNQAAAAVCKQDMEEALYRFFTARVGLRFLTEHHVLSSGRRDQAAALRQVTNLFALSDEPDDEFLGCIQTNCNVVHEVTKVAELVRQQTVEYYSSGLHDDTSDGNALCPPIEIVDCNPHDDEVSDYFTYVPHHLHYMMAELLKNSVRATIRHHHSAVDAEDDGQPLPRIRVIIAKGKEDVTIKICDKGGGIPRSRMQTIWKFDHTTSPEGGVDDSDFFGSNAAGSASTLIQDEDDEQSQSQPPQYLKSAQLSTSSSSSSSQRPSAHHHHHKSSSSSSSAAPARMQGFGLPLARIYARYFGGELTLKSTEGYGLDAYLYLPRLGDACENLPLRVRDSPGAGDSTPSSSSSQY